MPPPDTLASFLLICVSVIVSVLASSFITPPHRITTACFEAEGAAAEFRCDFYSRGLWVAPERLPDYPASAPQRRLAKALVAPHRQRTLF
jgi:hypothetical protein